MSGDVSGGVIAIASAIDVAPPEWLVIPHPEAIDRDWIDTALGVFAGLAEIDARSGGTAVAPVPDAELALVRMLDLAAELPEGRRLVAGTGVARRWPLPVIVSTSPADPAVDLLELAGATGGLPIERPSVDELPGEDGPVVLRYDLDDDGAVLASLSWARRHGGVDTVAVWRTADLDAVPLFLPTFVALAERITARVVDDASPAGVDA